ncbi:MAG: helix-turn-helix transcriptional regulator [Spirochaetes bacterium]|nr:helix-turn-helix transcriptional regulator [Spirochaetota bacterium]
MIRPTPESPVLLARMNLVILELGELDSDAHWRHPGVRSPFHRLYWMREGDAFVIGNKVRTELLGGHVWFIPAGQTFDYGCRRRVVKGYAHLQCEWLPGMDRYLHIDRVRDLGTWKPPRGAFWPAGIRLAEAACVPALHAEIWARLSRLPLPAAPALREERLRLGSWKPVFDRVETQLRANLTVAELARAAGRNAAAFSRDFGKALGRSPKSWLAERLTDRARVRLLASDLPIREVAHELGFEDEFYFSRWFRRQTRMAPREFRLHGRTIPASPGAGPLGAAGES